MSSNKPNILNLVLFGAAIVVLIGAFMLTKSNKPIRLLPIFGSKEYNPATKDTDYHKVLDFKLTGEMGHTITLDSFKHKIFVANFFYATCPGICKKMNMELERAT